MKTEKQKAQHTPGPDDAIGIFLKGATFKVVLGSGDTRDAKKEEMNLPISGKMTGILCRLLKERAGWLAHLENSTGLLGTHCDCGDRDSCGTCAQVWSNLELIEKIKGVK